jgi:tRNA threonylcarbamoyladenosine biosynthesis protein TsaE
MFFSSRSVKATLKFAGRLSPHLEKGDILCLYGQLGSGKTVFTKGLAQGLGIKEDIISPSFVLIRQLFSGRLPLYHFDLYRLKDVQQILAIGYEEYFYGDGVCVIEWADRLGRLRPKECLKINLQVTGPRRRRIKITALGKRYQELLTDAQ